MAEVYKRVKGEAIQRFIARTEPAQTALDKHAAIIAARARAILAAEKAKPSYTGSGNSDIETDSGNIDRYIILADDGGSAMSIEYGRKGSATSGAMDGLFILHRAVEGA